ncbi:MAG: DUF4446 family protein [Nocardioidaceae bacterium]|nr:DUF4446 family protein [Nocardioidaceae bacterium]NUS51575.1 DUF4446 family protein [Nocardioidaceae bacterium]
MLAVLVAVLLLVSVAALVVGLLALRRTSHHARRLSRRNPATVPADLEGLRGEVQALRVESGDALRHLAVVRYDAFGDMGGHLSWSLALLDDSGNGIVLTSIHGRSEARTYAKNIATWSCDQAMSPEEEEAVRYAKAA